MIQSNELRVGNLIADHEAGGYFQVEEIYKVVDNYWVSYRNGSIRCAINELEEIPLTEEWLVKFGFQRFKKGFIKNNICIAEYYGGGLTIFLSNEKFDFKVDLYPVHQFQNLYFALTGQELTIKTKNL